MLEVRLCLTVILKYAKSMSTLLIYMIAGNGPSFMLWAGYAVPIYFYRHLIEKFILKKYDLD